MSTSTEQLTEEQEEYLKSLEEEFKDRYTEKDEGYKAVLERTPESPPIVEYPRRDNRCFDDYHGRNNKRRACNDTNRFNPRGRYSHSSRHNYGYRQQNHYPDDNRWH